jgi:hypothetical protein
MTPRTLAPVLGSLVCLTGCAPMLPTGQEAFAKLVHGKVELGEPAFAAAADMRTLGLAVSEATETGDSHDPQALQARRQLLFCSRTAPAFFLMDREWRVLLYLTEERVVEVVPQVNITGP